MQIKQTCGVHYINQDSYGMIVIRHFSTYTTVFTLYKLWAFGFCMTWLKTSSQLLPLRLVTELIKLVKSCLKSLKKSIVSFRLDAASWVEKKSVALRLDLTSSDFFRSLSVPRRRQVHRPTNVGRDLGGQGQQGRQRLRHGLVGKDLRRFHR